MYIIYTIYKRFDILF